MLFCRNYSMILCNSDEDPSSEYLFLNMLLAKQVDGIILLPTCENKRFLFSLVEQRRVPIVLIDRWIEGLKWTVVPVRQCLWDLSGYKTLDPARSRNVLHSSAYHAVNAWSRTAEGYDQALREAGLAFDPSLVVEGRIKAQEAYDLAKQILEMPVPPTALMVSSNRLLTGILGGYAKEHKLCIPDDFALAVFDDIPHYAYITPSHHRHSSGRGWLRAQCRQSAESGSIAQGIPSPRIIGFPVELVVPVYYQIIGKLHIDFSDIV